MSILPDRSAQVRDGLQWKPTPAPPREPLGPLLQHAIWWLRSAPEAGEFDIYGHEARHLIEHLSLRLIDEERDHLATRHVCREALAKAVEFSFALDGAAERRLARSRTA